MAFTAQNIKPTSVQDQLWIDVDSQMKKPLFAHLKKYMWKKQAILIDVDVEDDQQKGEHKPSVYAGYNHLSTIAESLDKLGMPNQYQDLSYRPDEYANLIIHDPRGSHFGLRILCMQEEFGMSKQKFTYQALQKYHQFQMLMGATPSRLMINKLPFQFNVDILNAVAFSKGCYLGQQIVSRSYFTGIVRKRVIPFVIDQSDIDQSSKTVKIGSKLFIDQTQIGKVIFYQNGETGLALINYLPFFQKETDNQNDVMAIKITKPFNGKIIFSLKQFIEKYVTDTRSKQKTLEELDI